MTTRAYLEPHGSPVPGHTTKRRWRFVVPNVAEGVHMLGTYSAHTRVGALLQLHAVFKEEGAELPEIVDSPAKLFS